MSDTKLNGKNLGGRPAVWTDADYEHVLEYMQEGLFLREIAEIGLPGPNSVWKQTLRDPGFRERYARAREMQSHAHAERAVMAARNATPETAHLARVQFDAERWIAGKLSPRDYGDKIEATVTIHNGLADRLNAAMTRTRVIDVEPEALPAPESTD